MNTHIQHADNAFIRKKRIQVNIYFLPWLFQCAWIIAWLMQYWDGHSKSCKSKFKYSNQDLQHALSLDFMTNGMPKLFWKDISILTCKLNVFLSYGPAYSLVILSGKYDTTTLHMFTSIYMAWDNDQTIEIRKNRNRNQTKPKQKQNRNPKILGRMDLKSLHIHSTLRREKFLFCCLWHMIFQPLYKRFQAVTVKISYLCQQRLTCGKQTPQSVRL